MREARLVLAVWRVTLYGLIAVLVLRAAVGGALDQLRGDNAQLVTSNADKQQQIANLQATIDDLRSRWIGDPALWQPTAVPAGITVAYYPVSGVTQADLEQAIVAADLCHKYSCLPDPGAPTSGSVMGMEIDGQLAPSSEYCYGPQDLSYHWTSHQILVPQWQPKPGDPKITTVVAWNALEAVIWTHELGHVTVADDWLASENQQSKQLASCQATYSFWSSTHLFDSLNAAQNAYHARLRADCRPEVGCLPYGWMGW